MKKLIDKLVIAAVFIGLFEVAIGLATLPQIYSASAATTPNSFITPQTPNRGGVRFNQGTDGPLTYKTLYTAGANGSRCYTVLASNNDSVTHALVLTVYNAGTQYLNIEITTSATAGNVSGTPPNNLIGAFSGGLPVDQNGNPFIQLISGDTLQMEYGTALTSATFIAGYAYCVDY
jgi:hypothetical protein